VLIFVIKVALIRVGVGMLNYLVKVRLGSIKVH
jgi:hypothetical protein